MPPSSWARCSSAATVSAGRVTSATAKRYAAGSACAISFNRFSRRPTSPTAYPCAAKHSARPRPMPEVAPMTIARFICAKIGRGKRKTLDPNQEITAPGGECGSAFRDARRETRPAPGAGPVRAGRDSAPAAIRNAPAESRRTIAAAVRKSRPAYARRRCGPSARVQRRSGRIFRAVRPSASALGCRTSLRYSPTRGRRCASRYSRRRTPRRKRTRRHAAPPLPWRAHSGKRPPRPIRYGGCGPAGTKNSRPWGRRGFHPPCGTARQAARIRRPICNG